MNKLRYFGWNNNFWLDLLTKIRMMIQTMIMMIPKIDADDDTNYDHDDTGDTYDNTDDDDDDE